MTLSLKRVCYRLVPWLLAFGLACRGTSPPATIPPVGFPTPTRPATAPVTATTAVGPTGLAGQVLAASDVSGRSDVPLPDQLVLAVPVDQADAVLGPGTASLDETDLRFLKSNLAAPHPALSVALTDAAGSYVLTLPPGDYLLCLADSDLIPPSFPARTRGCGRATVPAAAIGQVDVSSGFGEILLIPR